MSWNHRVLAHKYESGEIEFNIHEVHYEGDVPVAYTKKPIPVLGESLKSLRWTLNKMKECLKKPVLWAGDEFPKEFKNDL